MCRRYTFEAFDAFGVQLRTPVDVEQRGVKRQTPSTATVEAVVCRALFLPGGDAIPMDGGSTKVAAVATSIYVGDAECAPHVIRDSRWSTSIVMRLERVP